MAENSEEARTTTRASIYRAARSIKRRDNSLYNALRSTYQDSIFVHEISQLWPKLSNPPMVIPIICHSTLLASIFIFLFSLSLTSDGDHDGDNIRQLLDKWDCSLHLPLWVSNTEKASIEARLDEWTRQLDESGADIAALASCLKKPLRPLWVSQKTVIWLNEVPEHDSWDFIPLTLVSELELYSRSW